MTRHPNSVPGTQYPSQWEPKPLKFKFQLYCPSGKLYQVSVYQPCSSYLLKSISTRKSSRSAWPMTGRKKSSVMRLGVMVLSVEAASRMPAKRPRSAGWSGWTTSLRACWASCCKSSTNWAAFRSFTSVEEDRNVSWVDKLYFMQLFSAVLFSCIWHCNWFFVTLLISWIHWSYFMFCCVESTLWTSP